MIFLYLLAAYVAGVQVQRRKDERRIAAVVTPDVLVQIQSRLAAKDTGLTNQLKAALALPEGVEPLPASAGWFGLQ